jgi:hemerythrin
MTTLTWEDKFNTGVETLDGQHRKIFDYMITIYNGLIDSHLKCDPFNGMLDQLELLCQLHFMEEEKLMDESNYPLASEHKHLHDLFLTSISLFKIDNKQCHTSNVLTEFSNLRVDFITHMLNDCWAASEGCQFAARGGD